MIIMRIITAVCAVPIFTMTTKPSELMEALMQIKVPFVFSFILVTAMRFTPMVQDIWDRIVDAQKLRRFDIERMNIFSKAVKAYVPMMIPLFLPCYEMRMSYKLLLNVGVSERPQNELLEEGRFGFLSIAFEALISGVFAILLIIRFFYMDVVLNLLFTFADRFITLISLY